MFPGSAVQNITTHLGIATAVLLMATPGSRADVVTLQPTAAAAQDTTVYEGFPTGNLSGGDNAGLPPSIQQALGGFTGFLVVSQTSSGNDLQSLVGFGLDALAGVSDNDVTAATLSLYPIDSTQLPFPTDRPRPGTAIDISVYSTTHTWDQATVTWQTVPYARDGQNSPTGAPLDTVSVSGIDAWVDFDVTADLKAALQLGNAAVAYALASPTAVSDPTSGNEVSLVAYAAESSAFVPAALQPKLTVTLVPEPAAGLAVALALVPLSRRRSAATR